MSPAASPSSRSWQVWFVTLGLIWGCSFWWIKLGLRALSPVDVAFARLGAGALTLVVASAVTRGGVVRRARTWGHLFVVALLLNSVPFTLFSFGETHVSAVLAGLVNAFTPLATLAVALFVLRLETPSTPRLVGLGLGFVGVVVLIGIWRGLGSHQWLGVGACLGAVLCYGFGFAYARAHLRDPASSPLSLATGQVLCGAVQLLPFALWVGHVRSHAPLSSWVALSALGILGTGLAYVLNFRLVRSAPASVVSSVTYFTPVVSVIVGVAFLGESLSWNEPVGALIILVGAAMTQGRLRRRRALA